MEVKHNCKISKSGFRKILVKETQFINDLLSKIPDLNRTVTDGSEEEDDPESKKRVVAAFPVSNRKTVRASNLEELENQLNSMKGKKNMKFKEKMLKKKLKNKLTKKKKKEKFKMQKTLVKTAKLTNNTIKSDPDAVVESKPVFNSESKMMFSKVEFPSGERDFVKRKKNKIVNKPQKLLVKLKKQNEKIKTLENEGKTDVASQIKEKQAWMSAIKKSKREKVKDDPSLLKKSIKRRESEKRRNQKKWKERKANVEKAMKEKQAKRKSNIEERKKQVKMKKMKKAAKKGRVVPGL